MEIVGRLAEVKELNPISASKRPELLAIYGHRRFGKTFLIREYFQYNFDFYATGSANSIKKTQLENFSNAGSTTRILNDLTESGFIRTYKPFGVAKSNGLFQLVDFFSLFYLRFMKDNKGFLEENWLMGIDNPKQRSWSGYAFEMVCLQHVQQIKASIGISGVQTQSSSWVGSHEDKNCQIDLLIDRRDQVINVCEVKFSINKYSITKSYSEDLLNKIAIFRNKTGTNKSILLTFISTFGLQPNGYSQAIIQNSLTMDDLFGKG